MTRNKKILNTKNPKLQPGGAPVSIINNQIDVRPFHRTNQDIQTWRNALQHAESRIPRRVLLYDLYADVVLDGHVESVTQKRMDAVTSAGWKFVDKEGAEVDAINELIDTIGFDDMLSEIINSRFWGYSMLEPKFFTNSEGEQEMSLWTVPKLNMRPELGIISNDAYSDDGLNIRKGIYAKTIMEVGRTNDLGLLLKVAPYQVLKRGGLGDYAMFVQVFGNPLVDATWDGYNDEQRVKLLEAINALGQGGAIVRPEGTNVELLDKSANANGDLQTKFINLLNKEISKTILGSTETTEASESSGYAQSKTHEGQDDRKHESDIKFARRILNSRFIPILKAHGFDTKGGKFIVAGEEDSLTKKEMFEIHKGLATEMKLPMDDDFLYETYGIPKPDNYDQLKSGNPTQKEDTSYNKSTDDKPKRKKDQNKEPTQSEELSLFNRFKSFFGLALTPKRVGAKQPTSCCGDRLMIKLSEVEEEFNNEELINKAFDASGNLSFEESLFKYTLETLLKGFKRGTNQSEEIKLAELGINYGFDDPELIKAFENNIFRFSAGKTQAMTLLLNELFREATSFEEFYRLAKQRMEIFNVSYLETEYNTAQLTGEAAATYKRLMGQIDIFPYWEYKTLQDENVRKSHRNIHGIILPADDPRWQQIFPPNGWNCRCYVVPRLAGEVDITKIEADRSKVDALLESPEWEKTTSQGWGINRADEGVVFAENQQYVKSLPPYVIEIMERVKREMKDE